MSKERLGILLPPFECAQGISVGSCGVRVGDRGSKFENLVAHRSIAGLEVVIRRSRHGRTMSINGEYTPNRKISGSGRMGKTVAWSGTIATLLSLQILQEIQHRLSHLDLYSVWEPVRG